MYQKQKMKNNTKILSVPNFESQQAWKVTIIDQIFFSYRFHSFPASEYSWLCWSWSQSEEINMWKQEVIREVPSNVYLCGEYMRALSTSAGGIVYTCSVHKKSRHHNVEELIHNEILFLLDNVSLWVCNFMSHVYIYITSFGWCSFQ